MLALAQLTGDKRYLRILSFVIGAGFLALGLIITVAWSLPGILAVRDTTHWQEIPCTIVTSEVLREQREEGLMRYPDIRYHYEYHGRGYESDVVDVFWTSINGGMNAQEVVRQFSAGETVPCWVNPQNPDEAALRRGWQGVHNVAFLPLVLIVPGLVLMVLARWRCLAGFRL